MGDRAGLLERLESHYRDQGWSVARDADGTLLARGPGGVTWLGTAIVADDLSSDALEGQLLALSDRRMPGGGELCPVDLLSPAECEPAVRTLLDRLGLSHRPHVSLYSLAA